MNGPDADPNGAVLPLTLVGVNNTAIPTLQPHLAFPGATYEISPDLPASLVLDAINGRVSGVPTETLAKTTFTVWANHWRPLALMGLHRRGPRGQRRRRPA